MLRALAWVFGVVLGAVILFAAPWFLLAPSHDRAWRADFSRLPTVSETDDGVPLVREIRNWSYREDGKATERAWIDRAMDPERLERIWFVVEPFGESDAIAHTMLSFEFDDGAAYIASVEARREEGETYSAVRGGLIPSYEYMVVWATERDMYANTVYLAQGELLMYPLDLNEAARRSVLEAMLSLTADVSAEPRWYHTLFANCTNVLARAVNAEAPSALPHSSAWYLPGYAAEYLHEQGVLGAGRAFSEVASAARATAIIPEVYESAEPDDFAETLRKRLTGA